MKQDGSYRVRAAIAIVALGLALWIIVDVLMPIGTNGPLKLIIILAACVALFAVLGKTVVIPRPPRRCPRCKRYGLQRIYPDERHGVRCTLCDYRNEDEVWDQFEGLPENGQPVEYVDGRRPCHNCPACGSRTLERIDIDTYFGVRCYHCGYRNERGILEDYPRDSEGKGEAG